jgi:5'-nucleotidase/UDP-sugar diphosphatase
VDKEVKHWEAEVTKAVDKPIGESRRHLPRADLRVLVEHIMAEQTHADFAFINSGGLRADLPEGPLLARHIWNIMPFDNIIVTAKVKGSEVTPAMAKDRPIDPDREYTLAATDFTAANQERELGVAHDLKFTTDGPMLRDVLIDWIKKQKVVGGD